MTRSTTDTSHPNTVPAGRINRLFGTDGGVMLSLYPAFPDEFDPEHTPLFVTIDRLEVPLWCERFERHGANGAVATFADLDTDARASELLGLEFRIIEVEEEEELSEDEFYLEDLVGFAVSGIETRAEGDALPFSGVITDYIDSEANPLFELEVDGRRILVPAAEEFFAHIDFEGGSIRLVLPEGMLHL